MHTTGAELMKSAARTNNLSITGQAANAGALQIQNGFP
jgi:hypothetical protein